MKKHLLSPIMNISPSNAIVLTDLTLDLEDKLVLGMAIALVDITELELELEQSKAIEFKLELELVLSLPMKPRLKTISLPKRSIDTGFIARELKYVGSNFTCVI